MAIGSGSSVLNKEYRIVVCVGELIFEGFFRCNFSQRLIDALNEGVRESPLSRVVDFLAMYDVTMENTGGEKKKFSQIYVAKNNIIFIAQLSGESRDKKLSGYPYRRKLPVGVTIYASQIFQAQVFASPYVLKGQLYVETWGQVADTIETSDRFLPLTEVEVDPAPPGEGTRFDFVAINKERIISLCEGRDDE